MLLYTSQWYVHIQAITSLNHLGVCLSYRQTWDYLKSLVQQCNFTTQIQQGCWLWVYDNLNIHQRIRHERQGSETCIHLTSSITLLVKKSWFLEEQCNVIMLVKIFVNYLTM